MKRVPRRGGRGLGSAHLRATEKSPLGKALLSKGLETAGTERVFLGRAGHGQSRLGTGELCLGFQKTAAKSPLWTE